MKSLTLVAAFFLFITSCKQFTGIPEDFDYGKIDNNTYSNKFFGFKLPLSNGWEALNKSYVDSLRAEGLKKIADGNAELEETFEASDIQTANLISIIKTDTLVYQPYSANLALMAENIRLAIQIKDGKSYLERGKDFMIKSGYDIKFVGPITEYEIDDQIFYTMEAINYYSGMEVHQDFYVTIINGFGLSFVGSWVNDEQRAAIRKLLTEITFD